MNKWKHCLAAASIASSPLKLTELLSSTSSAPDLSASPLPASRTVSALVKFTPPANAKVAPLATVVLRAGTFFQAQTLQITHLLVADLVWISLVRPSLTALADPPS